MTCSAFWVSSAAISSLTSSAFFLAPSSSPSMYSSASVNSPFCAQIKNQNPLLRSRLLLNAPRHHRSIHRQVSIYPFMLLHIPEPLAWPLQGLPREAGRALPRASVYAQSVPLMSHCAQPATAEYFSGDLFRGPT